MNSQQRNIWSLVRRISFQILVRKRVYLSGEGQLCVTLLHRTQTQPENGGLLVESYEVVLSKLNIAQLMIFIK